MRFQYCTPVGSGSAGLGWPIPFVEDLIVFFEQGGKSNIIDLDKILSIKQANPETGRMEKLQTFRRSSFGLGKKPHTYWA